MKAITLFIILIIVFIFIFFFLSADDENEHFPGISFEKDIKSLFRDFDVQSMKAFGIDLHKYKDVKRYSQKILSHVSEGSMPCDKPWSSDKVDLFKSWAESGMNP